MIEIYDDVCSYEDNIEFYQSFIGGRFEYGEYDMPQHPPTGLISSIDQRSHIFVQLLRLFNSKSLQLDTNTKLLSVVQKSANKILEGETKLIRPYVNLFLPNERPFFHNDGKCITCLFYFTPQYDIDEGGETQFLVNDNIQGILPKPSRLVIFDGTVTHRATSFRSKPRITAVIKFKVD